MTSSTCKFERSGPMRRHSLPGFTLLELMITISIAAILLAIGVPSFKYITSANRASSEINGLLGDLQFARGEAIKEGQTVTICASTNGTSCSVSTSWDTGWIVFSDAPPLGTIEGTDAILKIQPQFSSTDVLTADHGISSVTFSREGFTQGLGNNAVTITLHTMPVNAPYTRCLSMTIIGALSTQINGAPTAESPNLCN
jgi:type IV fimbrial biogenesis protein FimT